MDHDGVIVFPGTGSAFPQHSYNACSAICRNGEIWLTDAGGGNGIIGALSACDIAPGQIRHLMITHTHTDHILGAVWFMRAIINLAREGRYEGKLQFYGNGDVVAGFLGICRITLLESHFRLMCSIVDFHTVRDGDTASFADAEVRFFDVGSENVAQTGFTMRFPSGVTLTCLGDEALTRKNINAARGSDYLLCGAFCRYADHERFKPYEKHHYTVRDVAILAEEAGIANLILYHSEDVTPHREAAYKEEAGLYFGGKVFVPEDGAEIKI